MSAEYQPQSSRPVQPLELLTSLSIKNLFFVLFTTHRLQDDAEDYTAACYHNEVINRLLDHL